MSKPADTAVVPKGIVASTRANFETKAPTPDTKNNETEVAPEVELGAPSAMPAQDVQQDNVAPQQAAAEVFNTATNAASQTAETFEAAAEAAVEGAAEEASVDMPDFERQQEESLVDEFDAAAPEAEQAATDTSPENRTYVTDPEFEEIDAESLSLVDEFDAAEPETATDTSFEMDEPEGAQPGAAQTNRSAPTPAWHSDGGDEEPEQEDTSEELPILDQLEQAAQGDEEQEENLDVMSMLEAAAGDQPEKGETRGGQTANQSTNQGSKEEDSLLMTMAKKVFEALSSLPLIGGIFRAIGKAIGVMDDVVPENQYRSPSQSGDSGQGQEEYMGQNAFKSLSNALTGDNKQAESGSNNVQAEGSNSVTETREKTLEERINDLTARMAQDPAAMSRVKECMSQLDSSKIGGNDLKVLSAVEGKMVEIEAQAEHEQFPDNDMDSRQGKETETTNSLDQVMNIGGAKGGPNIPEGLREELSGENESLYELGFSEGLREELSGVAKGIQRGNDAAAIVDETPAQIDRGHQER